MSRYQNKTLHECLLIAAGFGDCQKVKSLLLLLQETEAVGRSIINLNNVRDKNNSGFTPLHKACWYGHYSIVQLLLLFNDNNNNKKKIVEVNIQDDYGRTPLHLACYNGYTNIIQVLLQNGAEIRIKTRYGKTAIDYARDNGSMTADFLRFEIRGKGFLWLKRRRYNQYTITSKKRKAQTI